MAKKSCGIGRPFPLRCNHGTLQPVLFDNSVAIRGADANKSSACNLQTLSRTVLHGCRAPHAAISSSAPPRRRAELKTFARRNGTPTRRAIFKAQPRKELALERADVPVQMSLVSEDYERFARVVAKTPCNTLGTGEIEALLRGPRIHMSVSTGANLSHVNLSSPRFHQVADVHVGFGWQE
jgi:hypothetical protein